MKATVTYPADEPTWTQEVFQKYGASQLIWEIYSCEKSGNPFSIADPAIEPTCEQTGITAGSHCGFCGEILVAQKEIAGGHQYQAAMTVPTCNEKGCTTYICSVCDHSYMGDEEAETGHSYDGWRTIIHADCIHEGAEKRTCIVKG